MAEKKVFHEVFKDGQTVPVWDDDAHTKIGELSSNKADASALTNHINDAVKHITSTERNTWNGKQDKLSNEQLSAISSVSSHINDNEIHIQTGERAKWNKVDDKVDTTDFETYKTSAGTAIENAKTAASAAATAWVDAQQYAKASDLDDYYKKIETSSKTQLATEFENYYKTTETSSKDQLATEFGKYYTTAQVDELIEPFITSAEADELYQPKGTYVSPEDLLAYYTKQEADETFQPIGPYATSAYVDDEIENLADSVEETYGDLFNTTIKAGTKITITSASGAKPDDIEYTINADAPDLPTFTAESGISAQYNQSLNQWKFGLERYDDAGFARFNSDANTYAASAVLTGYHQQQNLNPNKITLTNDKIVLQPGLYHIDMQLTLTTDTPENNYYTTTVKALAGSCVDTKIIDASFSHSETLDLSYDISVLTEPATLDTSVEGFQVGGSFTVSNLNIHEILQVPASINGGGSNYVAGDGIRIANDTVSVKVGDGLWVPASSNNLEVKLGKGLTFSSDGGINALVIDDKVENVVATVSKLSEDLDTKVTVNMPFADITTRHQGTTYFDQYIQGSATCLAQLFSVPINNKLYVSADGADKATCISVISNQAYNGKVIFGLFEYVYDAGGGNGDTNWVGDTGPVNWDTDGRHEFPLIHMAEGAELKAENAYYAVMCAPTGDIGNLWLAGTSTGYSPTFNAHPRLTFGFGNAKYKDNTGIDFTTTAGTLQNIAKSYSEDGHNNPRFFMQIRNKSIA